MSVDRLQALLANFSLSARMFHAGALCGITDFSASEGTGQLHLVRSGRVVAQHAGTLVEHVGQHFAYRCVRRIANERHPRLVDRTIGICHRPFGIEPASASRDFTDLAQSLRGRQFQFARTEQVALQLTFVRFFLARPWGFSRWRKRGGLCQRRALFGM